MKQINEAITNLKLSSSQTSSTKSQPKTLEKTALPIHWITELFKVFQSRYFAKWSTPISGIEDRAIKEWSKGLSGITTAQLKHGVDTWGEEWPPSLSEFRNCCLSIHDKEDWKHKGGAYKILDTKLIGIVKSEKSKAREEMDAMRKILGISYLGE